MMAINTNNGPATGPLLRHDNIDVNKANNNGWTALMMAACMWIRDQVVRLLSHDQIDVNIKNNVGRTALFYAVGIRKGSLECKGSGWNEILNHEVVEINIRDNSGGTALMWAKDVDIAQKLLDHEDIEVTMECEEAEVAEVRDLICQHVNNAQDDTQISMVSPSRKKRHANKLDL